MPVWSPWYFSSCPVSPGSKSWRGLQVGSHEALARAADVKCTTGLDGRNHLWSFWWGWARGRDQLRTLFFLHFLRQVDCIQNDKRVGLVFSLFFVPRPPGLAHGWLITTTLVVGAVLWTPSGPENSGLAFSVKLPCCWSPRWQPHSPESAHLSLFHPGRPAQGRPQLL